MKIKNLKLLIWVNLIFFWNILTFYDFSVVGYFNPIFAQKSSKVCRRHKFNAFVFKGSLYAPFLFLTYFGRPRYHSLSYFQILQNNTLLLSLSPVQKPKYPFVCPKYRRRGNISKSPDAPQ